MMIQIEFTKQLSLACLRRENPYDGLTVILPISTRGPVACSDNYRQRTSQNMIRFVLFALQSIAAIVMIILNCLQLQMGLLYLMFLWRKVFKLKILTPTIFQILLMFYDLLFRNIIVWLSYM